MCSVRNLYVCLLFLARYFLISSAFFSLSFECRKWSFTARSLWACLSTCLRSLSFSLPHHACPNPASFSLGGCSLFLPLMNSMKFIIRYIIIHEKKTPNDAVTPQRQSRFTPKMKANAVPRLLSSLVWIDQYNECNGMTSFIESMLRAIRRMQTTEVDSAAQSLLLKSNSYLQWNVICSTYAITKCHWHNCLCSVAVTQRINFRITCRGTL